MALKWVSKREYERFQATKRKQEEPPPSTPPPVGPNPWQQAMGGYPQPEPYQAPPQEPIRVEPPAPPPPPPDDNPWRQAWQGPEQDAARQAIFRADPGGYLGRQLNNVGDVFGALNEAARPVNEAARPVAEFAQEWGPSMIVGGIAAPLVKPVVDKTLEYFPWESENVNPALAEYGMGPELRDERGPRVPGPVGMASRFARDVLDQGSPGDAWQAAKERWAKTPEPFPGVKGLGEALVAPSNAFPLPGLQGVARGVKAIDQALPGIAEKAGVMGRRLATEQGGFIHPEGFTGPKAWPGRETTFRVQLTPKEQEAIASATTGAAKDRIRHAAEKRAARDFEARYNKEHGNFPGYSSVPKFLAVGEGGLTPKEYPWRQAKPTPPTPEPIKPDVAGEAATPPEVASFSEGPAGEAKQADVTLFHGTNADFADPEIATGKKMFGIHLTTDAEAAAEYGKVKTYSLAADAKVLDLSDGDDLWEFMRKNEILDADDLDNVDLENYVKSGQLYQYDISSRTHFADYVARQAQSMGYDVVKMIDNLRGLGDDTAYVVVNPKALKSAKAKPPVGQAIAQTPEQIYDAARETASQATRDFRAIQTAYRSKQIGDQEFLAGKAAHDTAMAEFDKAETAFIEAKNAEVQPPKAKPPAEAPRGEPPIGEPTPPASEVPPVASTPPTIGTGRAGGQTRRDGPLPAQQTTGGTTPPTTPAGPIGPTATAPQTAPPVPPTQTTNPPRGDNWLPDIKKNPELESLAYQDDAIRRVTDKLDNVITRNVMQAVGEPMRDVFTKGLVIYETVKADWRSGVVGAMARLRAKGSSDKLFKVDKDGYANIGGQRIATGDVAEYPGRYNLSPEQTEYIRRVHHLLDDMKDRLTENGIEVKELLMEQGGHWVPRKAMGKLGADGEIEMVQVGSGSGGRVGAKASFEKHRSFKTEQEALDAGYRYLSLEEAVESALQAAGRKIADQRLIDLVLPQIPHRTGAAPAALKLAKEHAVEKLRALHNLKLVINRGYRGERVPDQTVAAIGRYFSNEAAILIQAGITKPENPLTRALLQQAEAAIPGLKATASQEANRARNAFTKAREKAMKPKMGESTVQAPAFQGKFFSDEDARRLQTIMDIRPLPGRATELIRGGAEAVSAVNAVPRLLQATYDLGTPLIQGMPTLFYRPREWGEAYKQSLAAMRSPAAQQAYYEVNADVIKWSSERGLNLLRSEFSQALERGSLTQRGIHAVPVLGRITEAASRGYETYLNALKIEGVKATRAMATTSEEERALMKFWNDMAGTPDTAVQGISATQRSVETAALYAPRYWRSGLSLMTSIARGGIRGDQARAAVSHLIVGGLMGYVGVSYLLGQTPKLDPTDRRFLTVNIFGQDVGPGSTFFTLNRALLRMALHPEKIHEIAGDYVTSKGSPLISTIKSAPYYHGGVLEITAQIVKKNLLPFSLQSMLLERHEDTGAAVVAGVAGFLGGRTVQPDQAPRRKPKGQGESLGFAPLAPLAPTRKPKASPQYMPAN